MKKIVYIDMDDTMVHFKEPYFKSKIESPHIQYPQSQLKFFEDLEPIEGAIDAFNYFLNSDHFDPYILTAPSIKNLHCYTEKAMSIKKNLGEDVLNRLIISPVKNLLKGDYLIDDNFTGKGQDLFEGELILFGSSEFPDWNSILNHLKSLNF
jgi:5'-nucleotidase